VGEENQGSEGGENNISWYDLSLCDEFDFFSMNNRQKIIWNVNQNVFFHQRWWFSVVFCFSNFYLGSCTYKLLSSVSEKQLISYN
jgi:hypothetical protein